MSSFMLVILGLLPLMTVFFEPRSFDDLAKAVTLTDETQLSRLLKQLGVLFVFLTAASLVAWELFSTRFRVRWRLFLPVVFLWIGVTSSMLFSLNPKFSFGHITSLMALSALALRVKGADLPQLIRVGKGISLLYIWLSLLAAPFLLGWALEIGYLQGYIPGLNVRLHGIAIHANQLGIFAWLYVLLEVLSPSPKRLLRFLNLSAALGVLVLAQSKTAWAILLFSMAMWFLIRRPRVSLLLIGLSVLGVLAAILTLLIEGWRLDFTVSVLDAAPSELLTLTGRTFIWEIVLQLVSENPLFGYGTTLWSPEMALSYAPFLGWVVLQSHNQYLQSLGEGGILGLSMFMLYAVFVLWFAFKARGVMGGLGLVMFMSLLLRGLTEVWFGKAVVDGHLFFHGYALAVVFSSYEYLRRDVPVDVKSQGPVETTQEVQRA